MDQVLLKPLAQLETSLNTLLTSLTTTNTYAAAPGAAQSLLEADDDLTSALVQLKQHQDNYNRTLTLRAEADRLHNQLRDIVRTCVELRSEIGEIHPSILDDTDSEDDNTEGSTDVHTTTRAAALNTKPSRKRENKPVEYETLLGFAARIGKHNAAAAIEAERQSNRRYRQQMEADGPDDRRSRSSSQKHGQDASNGGDGLQTQRQRSHHRDMSETAIIDTDYPPLTVNNPTTDTGDYIKSDGDELLKLNSKNATAESLAELAAINDTLAHQRAYQGMAFPAAEALRMGALGRLQYLREQEGEDAVEREVERMVRESEGDRIAAPTDVDTVSAVARKASPAMKASSDDDDADRTASAPAATAAVAANSAPSQQTAPQSPSQPQQPHLPSLSTTAPATTSTSTTNQPAKPKMTLDLDFPDSDEDEDDDDV